MSGFPFCGRCAERLPCGCLGAARAELAELQREQQIEAAARMRAGKSLRGVIREVCGLAKCRPLWQLALEQRRAR